MLLSSCAYQFGGQGSRAKGLRRQKRADLPAATDEAAARQLQPCCLAGADEEDEKPATMDDNGAAGSWPSPLCLPSGRLSGRNNQSKRDLKDDVSKER